MRFSALLSDKPGIRKRQECITSYRRVIAANFEGIAQRISKTEAASSAGVPLKAIAPE